MMTSFKCLFCIIKMTDLKNIIEKDLNLIIDHYTKEINKLIEDEIYKVSENIIGVNKLAKYFKIESFGILLLKEAEYLENEFRKYNFNNDKSRRLLKYFENCKKLLNQDPIFTQLTNIEMLNDYLKEKYAQFYTDIMISLDIDKLKKYINDNNIEKIDFFELIEKLEKKYKNKIFYANSYFCNRLSKIHDILVDIYAFCYDNFLDQTL